MPRSHSLALVNPEATTPAKKPAMSTVVPTFMTAIEVAGRLQFSKRWVNAHASGARLPRLQGYKAGPSGSKAEWRFKPEDVNAFIEQLRA